MSDAPPELTRLVKQVRTNAYGTRTLTVSFLVSTQQMLMGDFESAAHDAVLRHAHADGHMPVGPIFIETTVAESSQLGTTCPLCEGKGWLFEPDEKDCPDCDGGKIKPARDGFAARRSLEEIQIDNEIMKGDLVQVHGTVELGLSL